jgi:5-methylcytosine-specific restriction endonuclease McrA
LRPTPEFQLEFLNKLQRLFSEGDFTATYKFALLIALADLSVELGQDDDSTLQLPFKTIGLKFIQLYWQQAAPYKGDEALSQNQGTQAAVIKAISDYRRKHPSLQINPASTDFSKLLTAVSNTVKTQPIQYIQNLGGGKSVFLFDTGPNGITLLPGVAYCLRRFQPLVQQLSRNHWIDHIKSNKQNIHLLGQENDLESFLFETSRQALTVVAAGLRKISSRCHYCGQTVREADVDHFIPHSLYPRDLIHNFVLAHPTCNRSKSDTLAAKQHLSNWLDFIQSNTDNLQQIGKEAGIIADLPSTDAVARWGYANAVAGGSQAWVKPTQYESVDTSYMREFS